MVCPDRYLRDVNELLQSPETEAMGGYAMGVVTVVADNLGRVASRRLLARASKCRTKSEAFQVAEEWLKKQRPRA
jgi:hypothetical protein